jgi:hypothetical protein
MKLDNVSRKVENSVSDSVRCSVQDLTWISVPNSVWYSMNNSVFTYLRCVFHFKFQMSQRMSNEIK